MARVGSVRSAEGIRDMRSQTRSNYSGLAQVNEEQFSAIKHAGDVTAVVVAAGTTFTSLMPAIASLFSIVWLSIRIWETKTIQDVVAYIRGD